VQLIFLKKKIQQTFEIISFVLLNKIKTRAGRITAKAQVFKVVTILEIFTEIQSEFKISV
jgi:hypothetical protein